MPPQPSSDLVMGQSCVALATLKALFDTVLGLRDTREFLRGRIVARVGQIVVELRGARLFDHAQHHQDFFSTNPSLLSLCDDTSHRDVRNQGTFVRIANVNAYPCLCLFRKPLGPVTNLLEGTLTTSLWYLAAQIADCRVRR